MTNVVTAGWLEANRNDPQLVVLDASLSNPANFTPDGGTKSIPGAIFFDLEKVFSDASSALPNTMIGMEKFECEARKLGIGKSSVIVVYDNKGIYSSPRVWWMFRSMGHQNVFVLDGGLPEWERNGFPISDSYANPENEGDFKANSIDGMFCDSSDVMNELQSSAVIDVRTRDRFYGLVGETRNGLRKGHIPTSVNIPYETFLENGKLKSKPQLLSIFGNLATSGKMIFSCGSGVTACIGVLAATCAGLENISVYDGSWSDWGREISGLQIE